MQIVTCFVRSAFIVYALFTNWVHTLIACFTTNHSPSLKWYFMHGKRESCPRNYQADSSLSLLIWSSRTHRAPDSSSIYSFLLLILFFGEFIHSGKCSFSCQVDIPLCLFRIGRSLIVLIRLQHLTCNLVRQWCFFFRVKDSNITRLSSIIQLRLLSLMIRAMHKIAGVMVYNSCEQWRPFRQMLHTS